MEGCGKIVERTPRPPDLRPSLAALQAGATSVRTCVRCVGTTLNAPSIRKTRGTARDARLLGRIHSRGRRSRRTHRHRVTLGLVKKLHGNADTLSEAAAHGSRENVLRDFTADGRTCDD